MLCQDYVIFRHASSMALEMAMLVSQTTCPDLNITTMRLIKMKSFTGIHGPQMMYPGPLTFPRGPP